MSQIHQMMRGRRLRATYTKVVAFTLIELLVVVAIIALLISILLPSLASAREGARSSVCLSSLKQMGNAVIMYTMDNKLVLPGPVHNPIYHDTASVKRLEDQTPGSLWWKLNLPYYVQKYMSDTSNSAKLVDKVLTCPTAARISVAEPATAGPPMYCLKPGHYIANTGGATNARARRAPVGGIVDNHPYYGTKPRNYFGWENVPATYEQIEDHNRTNPEAYSPKKIDAVKKQSDEWMVADLWYWDGSYGPGLGSGMYGTWIVQKQTGTTSSVFNSGKFKIPSYPYHNTTKSFDPNDLTDSAQNSPRLTTGRTNTVYFDGHAGGVRIWKGTVNPRFAADDVNKPPPPVIE